MTPDELKAELAQMTAENAKLRQEFENILEGAEARATHINDPLDPQIKELCEKFGYGRVMDCASRQWFKKDKFGAFIIAGCNGTIEHILKNPPPPGLGAAMLRVVEAAKASVKNPAFAGICDEDVELEHSVKALNEMEHG